MSETIDPTSSTQRYDTQEPGGDERHSLQTYVSDLLALVQHIQAPVDRQSNIDDSAHYSEALAIITDIKTVMENQRGALQTQLDALGGHPAAGMKSAWSSLLGVGAAAIDSVRKTKTSKNLRDDYTALGLASISYTMLHATALGFGDEATAALAQRSLSEITPIIVQISKVMPAVVLQELQDDGQQVKVTVAEISAKATHEAWQQPA